MLQYKAETYLIVLPSRKFPFLCNICLFEFYFWRTYDGQEIDLIEERGEQISAIEFKYSERNVRIPRGFQVAYPEANFLEIHKENYLQWLLNQ